MTLEQIRAKITGRVDDTDIDTAMLNDAINEAYFEIINDSRTFWKFMEGTTTLTTVAGTAQYEKSVVGADIDEIYSMYHNDGVLTSINERDLDGTNYQSDSTGIPMGYSEWAGNITLFPTPSDDRAITVKYYKQASELVNDSDEPIIPRKFQDVLVAGAKVAFYEMDEDMSRYDRALPSYQKKLKDMIEKNETASDRTFSIKIGRSMPVYRSGDYR